VKQLLEQRVLNHGARVGPVGQLRPRVAVAVVLQQEGVGHGGLHVGASTRHERVLQVRRHLSRLMSGLREAKNSAEHVLSAASHRGFSGGGRRCGGDRETRPRDQTPRNQGLQGSRLGGCRCHRVPEALGALDE